MRLQVLISVAIFATIAACSSVKPKHTTLPETRYVDRPVKVYVEIDKELTKRVPWERGVTPDKSMEAAKMRGEVAEQYERQLKAIEQVQGKAVP